MDEELVPPGFRFYPTEEEIISFYLHQMLLGRAQDKLHRVIPCLDVYEYNPWDLPQFAGEYCRGDPEQWFFFIPRQEKEARGGRPCRLTDSGYWKATGSPGYVYSSGNSRVIGVKKTMVFYQGRAPMGKKTEWKMNEYKAIEGEASSSATTTAPMLRQEWSLCRVYIKSKCVRAFDRRPSGVDQTTHEGTSRVRAHHQGEDQAILAVHPTTLPSVDTINSPENNSSSGDAAAASNPCIINAGIGNDQPMCDWEQLNWLPRQLSFLEESPRVGLRINYCT